MKSVKEGIYTTRYKGLHRIGNDEPDDNLNAKERDQQKWAAYTAMENKRKAEREAKENRETDKTSESGKETKTEESSEQTKTDESEEKVKTEASEENDERTKEKTEPKIKNRIPGGRYTRWSDIYEDPRKPHNWNPSYLRSPNKKL